jgi:acyl-CoA dehydrogenase
MRRSSHTPELEQFRARARGFLQEHVVPSYPSWKHDGYPPKDFWLAAGAAGLLGIGVPEQYGGTPGTTFRHSAVVSEEAQSAGLALGGLRVHVDICMPYLTHYATPDQLRRWMPRLTAGHAVAALALSEPGAGSDLKSLSTRAVRDGDHYVVDGSKTFISNGANADLVILAVKTDPRAGRDGISLLVVETDTPGFERGRKLAKLGLPAQDLAELAFTGMRVPADNLLGEENRGFSYLTANLAQERLSIAVASCAAAAVALDTAVASTAHLKLGQYDKFELASCAAEVESGRHLVDRAVELLEEGSLTVADAAAVKLNCTELQGRVVRRCLGVLGPRAYRAASIVGNGLLDGRVTRIFGGSSEIMKVVVSHGLGG